MNAAAISITKNTYSMAQPKTKIWISISVASGLARPMIHQMPTPVIAPKATVSSTKNQACCFKYAR